MNPNRITPIKGYCPRHRRVLTWFGTPRFRDALCSLDGCRTPLERVKPSTRGEIVDAVPIDGRPVLTLKAVG